MALDVSRSMCATDIEPNRLAVAQEAARSFVASQPKGTRIGIVAFAGFAELVVPPTTDKDALIAAINGFATARGTAIGSATLKALDAISAVNPDVPPIDAATAASSSVDSFGDPFGPGGGGLGDTAPPEIVPRETPKEGYIPDIVVLLTDGANTRGVDPIEAAKQAVDRRVRVYTIGFGTENPTQMVCSPEQLGGDAFGGGAFGGGGGGGGAGGGAFGGGGGRRGQFLVIDEPSLMAVAAMTGGQYYKAEDADQLTEVFKELPKQVELQDRDVEVSAAFAGFGALLAGAAMVLSLLWNRTP
jgi:Ca-activated chloride channel family protein